MSCPANPPAPAGFAVWRGPVPPPLSRWAVGLLKTVNQHDFGYTWQTTDPTTGKPVVARLDRHTWHFDSSGKLLTGLCWKGVTLYASLPQGQVGASTGDPLGGPPDPNAAVYGAPPAKTDWKLVALSAGAGAAVVGLFWAAIHYAGMPRLNP